MESKLNFHSEDQIKEKIEILRKGFRSKKTLDISFRRTQLKKLLAAVKGSYDQQVTSKKVDLGWSDFYTYYLSYTTIVQDLEHILANFESWSQKRSVDTPIAFAPASSYLFPEPYGFAWFSQHGILNTLH